MNDAGEMESKYEEKPRGIQPGTSPQVTPLKHVNMYKHWFTKENLGKAIEYLKSDGASVPPLFVTVDTRGTWSQNGPHLFWQANGSTNKLQVVAVEDREQFISDQWYKQDTPLGIKSLHYFLVESYLGITRADIKKFVQRQKPWQMIKPLRKKGKHRLTVLPPPKPFAMVEIDLGDMISFGQTQKEYPRFLFVLVDAFSGFCFVEVQSESTSKTSLASFKKILAAIAKLGYDPPRIVKSDQGGEFSGAEWAALEAKHKIHKIWTKLYPAVRVERKIRTLKTYIRMNSTSTRGQDTMWWNVVTPSVLAVNRIYQPKGGSPLQIVSMDMAKRQEVHAKSAVLRQKMQNKINWKPRENEPSVGDSVRVRIPGEKMARDYKGHLAYNQQGLPIKWTDELHIVEKKRVSKRLGTVRVLVNDQWRFWPAEVQMVPADTVPSAVWGQDGNVDFEMSDAKPVRVSKRKKRVRQRMDL